MSSEMSEKRRRFTREFKAEAVKLSERGDKTIRQVAAVWGSMRKNCIGGGENIAKRIGRARRSRRGTGRLVLRWPIRWADNPSPSLQTSFIPMPDPPMPGWSQPQSTDEAVMSCITLIHFVVRYTAK